MLELTKENFDAEVIGVDGLVVVDFWSEKCEPCLAIMPDIAALAEEFKDRAKFTKLNTAGNKRLAIAQKVMGVPAVLFYKNGEKVGALNQEEIANGGISLIKSTLLGYL